MRVRRTGGNLAKPQHHCVLWVLLAATSINEQVIVGASFDQARAKFRDRLPYTLIGFVPVFCVFYFCYKYYMASKRELNRMFLIPNKCVLAGAG